MILVLPREFTWVALLPDQTTLDSVQLFTSAEMLIVFYLLMSHKPLAKFLKIRHLNQESLD